VILDTVQEEEILFIADTEGFDKDVHKHLVNEVKTKKPKIIVIVGPTASGKTGWALKIAREFGGEIISADSRQVYRGMDIGTAKEVPDDVPHHLINVVNPDEEFTLAHFLDLAKEAINDIHKRGKTPIIAGGTGLYVQALIENWNIPEVAPNEKLREELGSKDAKELYEQLKSIDPKEAERLGLGKRYLIRALEVWHATGRKPSELKQKSDPIYDALVIGVKASREKLYERIDKRVEEMFEEGLEEEVKNLLKKYPEDLPAFRAIGYQEIIKHGDIKDRSGIMDLQSKIRFNTHNYARRQTTWLKRMKYIKWCEDFDSAYEFVKNFLV